MTTFPKFFFIFDVESIGLHGEGFAVAGGVYSDKGAAQYEFQFACPPEQAEGKPADRDWVMTNVLMLEVTHRTPNGVREAFWAQWMEAKGKYPDIVMAGECIWPVEAGFVARCVYTDQEKRNWEGPYPFHDIASIMASAGMDPMVTRDREPSELPAHNPMADARQSARLLAKAIAQLES